MRLLHFAPAIAILFASSRADAYLCTAVPNTNGTLSQAWFDHCIPYVINTSGALLDGDARRQLISQSFRVWTEPLCTDLSFKDLGYTDQPPGFDPRRNDNENIIMSIEDEAQADVFFTRNELAITVTAFNTATGEIFDADILINSASFPFADVTDEASCRTMTPLPFDLRNTLIHEIGHFIGFEHDGVPESTMFESAPECEIKKRDLTQDNTLGVCTVYGSGQPTMTCAPPDTYDKGPGDPSQFRNQCDVGAIRKGCNCATAETESSALWSLLLLGLLSVRRPRRSSGR